MRGQNDDHGAVIITRKEVRREQCLVVLGYIFSHTCVWFRHLGSKLELIASAVNNGPVAVMLRAILLKATDNAPLHELTTDRDDREQLIGYRADDFCILC
jgi:hypothetical protein